MSNKNIVELVRLVILTSQLKESGYSDESVPSLS